MAFRDRESFPIGINMYVPAMQLANAVTLHAPSIYVLGKPAAKATNAIAAGILANSAVGTTIGVVWTSDARYGRVITVTPSGVPGNANVMAVYGFDYLGQPMVEHFTGSAAASATLVGKKAFYRVTHTKVITQSTNPITVSVGTGDSLGLPYKGIVQFATEGGVAVALAAGMQTLFTDRDADLVNSGGPKTLTAPYAGYITGLTVDPDDDEFAGPYPALTVEIDGVAVSGLTAQGQAGGALVRGAAPESGPSVNNRFEAGDEIVIYGTAAPGGPAERVGVEISPLAVVAPDQTDPQTATSGDPRGLYTPTGLPNGVLEYAVGLVGNPSVNAAGNGGLHGLRQYYA